jgi:hypothetical protein
MDPVDVLTLAVTAAQVIRSLNNPEGAIAGGYELLGRALPGDQDEPMAIRVARLMTEAGERRRELLDYLRASPGARLLNRPAEGALASGAVEVKAVPIAPDPEAIRLLGLSEEGQLEEFPMLPPGFAPFEIGTRRAGGWFDENLVLVASGIRKERWFDTGFIPDQCAVSEVRIDPLPDTVRGLIDYPLRVPVLFSIATGAPPWTVWDICCAFADQYERIYEHPGRYGVWGHDLADLWIDGLSYCPEEKLILPLISS